LDAVWFDARLKGRGVPGPVPLSPSPPPREAMDVHEPFMRIALEQARVAAESGEVPVGAVVVLDGSVVGRGHNRPVAGCDPTAHAEVEALRDAARTVGNYRLTGATLYATVEPCVMCAGACLNARFGALVFGAVDEKAGAVVSRAQILDALAWNHRVRVRGGVLAVEAGELMQAFFRARRAEGYRSGRTGLDSKSSWG
jgi:tRNA(adenine34) deaminase